MTERSREDVLAGVLHIAIGGVDKEVPTLALRASRDWLAAAASRVDGFRDIFAQEESPETLAVFASASLDTILDVVVAYDTTSALGGREWLEEHADPSQLYGALRQMGAVALPFVNDVRTLLAVLPGLLRPAVASSSTNSTNGRSSTGASTPARSKSASTRRS